jgi:hypothetical protein
MVVAGELYSAELPAANLLGMVSATSLMDRLTTYFGRQAHEIHQPTSKVVQRSRSAGGNAAGAQPAVRTKAHSANSAWLRSAGMSWYNLPVKTLIAAAALTASLAALWPVAAALATRRNPAHARSPA